MLKQYIYCSYDWALSLYCSLYFPQGCATIPCTSLLVLLTEVSQGLPTDVSRRCSQIFTKIARWPASPRIRKCVHGQKSTKSLGHCCKIFSRVSFCFYVHTLQYEIHFISLNYTYVVWFVVFRAFLKKATVFWCVNANQLVICYLCFGDACCSHL